MRMGGPLVANKNPSPSTRFGAENGNPINLAGKTKEQREAEYEASKISAQLRLKALSVMLEKVEAGEMDPLDVVEPNALRLFKDSEDRAHGTPKQSVDHTSSDQTMTPVSGLDIKVVHAPKRDTDGTPV